MRTSTSRSLTPPTGFTFRSCSTRRSFTCMATGSSATSSSSNVPPCAASNSPCLSVLAPVELVAPLDLVAQDDVAAVERPPLERPLDHQPHLVHLEGLGQVVVGARLHGGDGRLGGGERGHHHHLGLGVELLGLGQDLEP